MSDLLLNSHGASLKDAGRLTFAAAKMGAEVIPGLLETIRKATSARREYGKGKKAVRAVGVSDSRISDYLNKKDYEDNAWVLAARFWQGLCVDLQQLSIVADIIQTKLHHKLATIDKMDALSLYTQVLPLTSMCSSTSSR